MPLKIDTGMLIDNLIGEEVIVILERDGFDVRVEGLMRIWNSEPDHLFTSPGTGQRTYAKFRKEDVHSVVVVNGELKSTIMLKNNDGENGDI